jgi:hypothetical protein
MTHSRQNATANLRLDTERIDDNLAIVTVHAPPARHPRPDPAQLDRVPPDSDRERAAWAAWLAYTERQPHPSIL